MTDYVVDASVAVEYLLKTPLGLAVGSMTEGVRLAAPELLDAEVLHALRKSALRGNLDEAHALLLLDNLALWPVRRIPHRRFTRAAWRHRHNVSAYDAFYVAVAEDLGWPLLTTDGPLSRAPGLGVAVHHVRLS